jgi:hypothetical protein
MGDDVLDQMPKKICGMCGLNLWLIIFGRDKTRPDGRAPYCKPCFRRYLRNWRAKREQAAIEQFLPRDGNAE